MYHQQAAILQEEECILLIHSLLCQTMRFQTFCIKATISVLGGDVSEIIAGVQLREQKARAKILES
jgi:hypothetical protein